MEPDKPFKTIEVIDSRTKQVCKIACMSCIRGHRTTSCGIPVCRTKIFWTVKRPGRPSNSCTCRYGSAGGCKCVVAKAACPHKPKKGEKRSGECRCDEQGRYCCLLEPQHWDTLIALQKPTVDFFPTREDLEAKHVPPAAISLSMSPTFAGNSPRASNVRSGSSMPASRNIPQPLQFVPSPYSSQSITPRFGMMGIAAPQGNAENFTPDSLSWESPAPPAPREYQPIHYQQAQLPQDRSCCQGPASPPPPYQFIQQIPPTHASGLPQQATFEPFGNIMHSVSIPDQVQPMEPVEPARKLDKFKSDYINYQFPSAICQTCGLNGCTCRNCPPVMQNANNGSWAQCCGRKHARTAAYVAPEAVHAYQEPPPQMIHFAQPARSLPQPQPFITPESAPVPRRPQPFQRDSVYQDTPLFPIEPYPQLGMQSPTTTSIPDFTPYDPGVDFTIPETSNNMDLSEFLIEDLEGPSRGCCCGDREQTDDSQI